MATNFFVPAKERTRYFEATSLDFYSPIHALGDRFPTVATLFALVYPFST
jgi:hypothetical protein